MRQLCSDGAEQFSTVDVQSLPSCSSAGIRTHPQWFVGMKPIVRNRSRPSGESFQRCSSGSGPLAEMR